MTSRDILKTARIAGALYLACIFLSLFAVFYARQGIVVPGDAAATAGNMVAFEGRLRLSIVSELLVQVGHVLLVLFLFKLLKPVNKGQAGAMVVLILVSVPITMLNELNQFAALLLSRGAGDLTAFTAEQLQALVPLFLDLREYGTMIAYVFWGLWLFPMGVLVFKSGYLPRFLGVLLMIGCFGYLVDFFTFFLFPDVKLAINVFTWWGELLLPLWLLIKGVNVERWEKRALEPA